jgi:hypothetical protein
MFSLTGKAENAETALGRIALEYRVNPRSLGFIMLLLLLLLLLCLFQPAKVIMVSMLLCLINLQKIMEADAMSRRDA